MGNVGTTRFTSSCETNCLNAVHRPKQAEAQCRYKQKKKRRNHHLQDSEQSYPLDWEIMPANRLAENPFPGPGILRHPGEARAVEECNRTNQGR